MTPLLYAIILGNVEIIQLLLNNQKLDINQKSFYFYVSMLIFIIWNLFKWKKTVLTYAIEGNNASIINLLVHHERIQISDEERKMI